MEIGTIVTIEPGKYLLHCNRLHHRGWSWQPVSIQNTWWFQQEPNFEKMHLAPFGRREGRANDPKEKDGKRWKKAVKTQDFNRRSVRLNPWCTEDICHEIFKVKSVITFLVLSKFGKSNLLNEKKKIKHTQIL